MACLACLKESPALLLEGALGERLKREYHLSFDPQVAMARLVEREEGRQALETLWREYRESARRHRLPFLATTPTRRANRERVARAGCGDRLFWENLEFLRQVRQAGEGEMYVGGLMGCRGDAYTGQGALAQREARVFHSWAAQRFAQAGADFLMAGIMPTLPEAAGMAQAMGETGLPYLISFTLRGDGCLIDGAPLSQAIAYGDCLYRSDIRLYSCGLYGQLPAPPHPGGGAGAALQSGSPGTGAVLGAPGQHRLPAL